jgi:5-methylthioadenosine/S-adenosylhomocysteine deaminase
MSTAFVNASVIPVQPGAQPYAGHLVVGDDGRVAATGPGPVPAGVAVGTTVDLDGLLVLPGFVSAHSHLWQSAFRGVADGRGTYAWLSRLHLRFGPSMIEEDMYQFTRHGGIDLLRHGVTTVCNHTHNFGVGAMGQWRATLDLPQRSHYAFSSTYGATPDERLADIRRFEAETAGAAGDPRILGRAVNTTGLLPVEAMRRESELLAELGLGKHAHYLEDPSEAQVQAADFPALVDGGRVGPDTVFAHFIHTNPEIVATAARLGAAMAWNPLSNGRLGSGIADVVGYRAAGMRVGLGLDGQASADASDPFQNMRTGLYLLRASAQDGTVMSCRDVLHLHTLGAAGVLGVEDSVGSLEVGKQADFVVLDPTRPSAGPVAEDVYAHVVLAMSAVNLAGVYVAGQLVSQGPLGTSAGVDAWEAHDVPGRMAELRRLAPGPDDVATVGSPWRQP